ncbi:hypothetical protein BIFGAL_03252 [Bifidobacterium gallicum DSM 20093 = LMG 11596]|uniref:Uncharacterized protein n=1 Tax=Bifidobacterium gallicum DSM 20093 = LMG 11596 TaxID=561180 RepID=D1NTT5_9BIFI|nr:hypothetical protein BIFGAL_03252 [Bifidobacterium gallicum DSM 20093 = LMG 11596]
MWQRLNSGATPAIIDHWLGLSGLMANHDAAGIMTGRCMRG